MIERYMYMGYYENDFKINNIDGVDNLCIYSFEDMLFMYFETERNDINPTDIISNMKRFPNGEKWVRMMNIFHYSKPISREYWKRKAKSKETLMRIVYLKPEKVSAYIFYHYKMQEEAHPKYDKFGSIFIYSNMLVMYNEYPEEHAEIDIEPTIPENNLPNYKGDIIKDMSVEWKDFDGCWRECKRILQKEND